MRDEVRAAWRRDPAVRAAHPGAVALGNASFLGVGYLLLGRPRTAALAVAVTVVLMLLLASTRSMVFYVILVLWWLAQILHGIAWVRQAQIREPRWTWWPAVGAALVVLGALVMVRVDGWLIDRQLSQVLAVGDCDRVSTVADEVGVLHRVASAPTTVRVDDARSACRDLEGVRVVLAAAARGDAAAALGVVDRVPAFVAQHPRHAAMLERELESFVARVPAMQPCAAVVVVDRLGAGGADSADSAGSAGSSGGAALDRVAVAVRAVAPAALVGCGDAELARDAPARARARYQQVVDLYPGEPEAARARDGLARVRQADELGEVRGRLVGDGAAYCADPVPYSAAPPYVPDGSRLVVAGAASAQVSPGSLPAEWTVSDPAAAVAVVCLGDVELGAPLVTCAYGSDDATPTLPPTALPEIPSLPGFDPLPGLELPPLPPLPSQPGSTQVTFHRPAVPVRVVELRTARVVADTRVEVSGVGCPDSFEFTPSTPGAPPPTERYVESTDADVRAAFAPLLAP